MDRLFAGSAGGTGTSGSITLSVNGNVVANGKNGVGIFAQSQAADGEGDINITLGTSMTVMGGSSNGIGVEMSGGINNSFTNDGAVSESDTYGTAIVGDTGNDTVNNFGTVIGSVDLGMGVNAFNLKAGALLASGTFIKLGAAGMFSDAGTISPGGLGTVLVTALTGDFTQTGDAIWNDDLAPNFTSDKLTISGTAIFGGFKNVINLNEVNGVATKSGSYTLLSAASGLGGASFQLGTMTGGVMPNGLTYSLVNSVTKEQLLLQPSQGPFYWNGGVSTAWNSAFVNGVANWSTGATGTSYIYGTPGAASDVYFASAASSGINTVTLGENFTVNSLNMAASASAVTIDGTETLSIAAAQGAGITVNSGAPVTTINVNIDLAGDQTWTNNSANALNISGTTVSSVSNQNLTIQGSGLTNIYSQIGTGVDALTKDGSGTVVLYNPQNLFSGGTFISSGVLAVGSAGALGRGDVINVGGILQTTQSLGGSARTIYVGGDYLQSSHGTLLLQVVSSPYYFPSTYAGTPGINYENLVVAGSARLGGTLDLNFASNPLVIQGERYVVVTAGTTLSGSFNTITTNLHSYLAITTMNDTFNGTMPANSAIVTLQEPFTSFPAGLNPNQTNNSQAIEQNLENLNNGGYFVNPNGTPAEDFLNNIITGLNTTIASGGDFGRALDELSPERLNLLRAIGFNNATFTSQQITTHLANERAGSSGLDTAGISYNNASLGLLSPVKARLLAWQPAPTPGLLSDSAAPLFGSLAFADPETIQPWNTFIAGNVILANVDGSMNVPGSSYTTGAVTAGADYRLTKDWTVGGLFGYSHTDASLDSEGSTATIDSYSPGVFASYSDSGWYANGLFTYTYNSYTENRNIIFPGVNRMATGSPQGNQYTTDFSGGYDFHFGHLTIGPSFGLDYVHLNIGSFSESGAGAASLNIQEQSADSMQSRIGFESHYDLKHEKTDYTYHLGAYWQHEYMGNSTGITSSMQIPTASTFTVNSPGPDRNSLLLDVGGDVQVLKNMDVFVDYSVQTDTSYLGQSIQAGVKVAF